MPWSYVELHKAFADELMLPQLRGRRELVRRGNNGLVAVRYSDLTLDVLYASRIKAAVPGDTLSEITNQREVFSGGKSRWASSAQVMLTAGDERGRDKLWHLHKKGDSSRRPAKPVCGCAIGICSFQLSAYK